jgi:hypothetical protein
VSKNDKIIILGEPIFVKIQKYKQKKRCLLLVSASEFVKIVAFLEFVDEK